MTNTSTIVLTKDFLLAGHCIFTVTSRKTDKHFTYRIMKTLAEPPPKIFSVGVLTGNERYARIGTIRDDRFSPTVNRDSLSVIAFDYFWRHLIERDQLAPDTIWQPSGQCACCGRTLTDPASIDRGIGPECFSRIQGAIAIQKGLF